MNSFSGTVNNFRPTVPIHIGSNGFSCGRGGKMKLAFHFSGQSIMHHEAFAFMKEPACYIDDRLIKDP